MHSAIIISALTLAAVPVLGQAATTTTPAMTAAPTTTPAPDTGSCTSLFYSLAMAQPGDHPAVSSWYSEQEASRSSALAATPSLAECMPAGFEVPSSIWPAMSSGRSAQASWESAHATEISSFVARCGDLLSSQQSSWLGRASSRLDSYLSCESRTRTRRPTTLATTTAAANSTTSGTTGSSTTGGTGAAQSGTPSGAGRVGGMGVVGVVAAAVFVGLASWM